MNSTSLKNELIFGYSSGNLGEAKSLFTSMYLYLNSTAARKSSILDNLLADNFNNLDSVSPKNLKYSDCIKIQPKPDFRKYSNEDLNQLTKVLGDIK